MHTRKQARGVSEEALCTATVRQCIIWDKKNPWEVLFGCPLSLKHHMNVRWNSTGQTADVAHAASAGYVSASVQPQASSASGFLLCVGFARPAAQQPNRAWGCMAWALRHAARCVALFRLRDPLSSLLGVPLGVLSGWIVAGRACYSSVCLGVIAVDDKRQSSHNRGKGEKQWSKQCPAAFSS